MATQKTHNFVQLKPGMILRECSSSTDSSTDSKDSSFHQKSTQPKFDVQSILKTVNPGLANSLPTLVLPSHKILDQLSSNVVQQKPLDVSPYKSSINIEEILKKNAFLPSQMISGDKVSTVQTQVAALYQGQKELPAQVLPVPKLKIAVGEEVSSSKPVERQIPLLNVQTATSTSSLPNDILTIVRGGSSSSRTPSRASPSGSPFKHSINKRESVKAQAASAEKANNKIEFFNGEGSFSLPQQLDKEISSSVSRSRSPTPQSSPEKDNTQNYQIDFYRGSEPEVVQALVSVKPSTNPTPTKLRPTIQNKKDKKVEKQPKVAESQKKRVQPKKVLKKNPSQIESKQVKQQNVSTEKTADTSPFSVFIRKESTEQPISRPVSPIPHQEKPVPRNSQSSPNTRTLNSPRNREEPETQKKISTQVMITKIAAKGAGLIKSAMPSPRPETAEKLAQLSARDNVPVAKETLNRVQSKNDMTLEILMKNASKSNVYRERTPDKKEKSGISPTKVKEEQQAQRDREFKILERLFSVHVLETSNQNQPERKNHQVSEFQRDSINNAVLNKRRSQQVETIPQPKTRVVQSTKSKQQDENEQLPLQAQNPNQGPFTREFIVCRPQQFDAPVKKIKKKVPVENEQERGYHLLDKKKKPEPVASHIVKPKKKPSNNSQKNINTSVEVQKTKPSKASIRTDGELEEFMEQEEGVKNFNDKSQKYLLSQKPKQKTRTEPTNSSFEGPSLHSFLKITKENAVDDNQKAHKSSKAKLSQVHSASKENISSSKSLLKSTLASSSTAKSIVSPRDENKGAPFFNFKGKKKSIEPPPLFEQFYKDSSRQVSPYRVQNVSVQASNDASPLSTTRRMASPVQRGTIASRNKLRDISGMSNQTVVSSRERDLKALHSSRKQLFRNPADDTRGSLNKSNSSTNASMKGDILVYKPLNPGIKK